MANSLRQESRVEQCGRNALALLQWLNCWCVKFDKITAPIHEAPNDPAQIVRNRVMRKELNELLSRWRPGAEPLTRTRNADRMRERNNALMRTLAKRDFTPEWWEMVELRVSRLLGLVAIALMVVACDNKPEGPLTAERAELVIDNPSIELGDSAMARLEVVLSDSSRVVVGRSWILGSGVGSLWLRAHLNLADSVRVDVVPPKRKPEIEI